MRSGPPCIARKAGLDVSLARAFLSHLRYHLKSEAEVAMLAHLAEALGDTQMAVRIGKTAIARGMNLVYYAYPIHSLPAYTPLRQPPEPAVIFGIARQESEFNSLTMSGAGARGILQVMPVTAKHVCRDYKIKCDIPRLMKDPAYNTMLGSAYISDRMDEFTRLLRADAGRLQRRARPGARMDQGVRRSARRQGRSDRLDPPHPLRGDARVRAEGALQHPDLPRPPGREPTPCASTPT